MKSVFLHIGLHKTGTTYLQQRIFVRFSGLYVVHSNPTLNSIVECPKDRDLLVSDEALSAIPWCDAVRCGESWSELRKRSLKNLASIFPSGKVLVGFRRQESLIESLYRQYLHEGGTEPIEKFFGDDCLIRWGDLYFAEVISRVRELFGPEPFFFTLSQLIGEHDRFLERLSEYLSLDYDRRMTQGRAINKGVRGYRARLLRVLNKITRSPLNPKGMLPLRNTVFNKLGVDPRSICQRHLPGDWGRDVGLSDEIRERIREFYSEDWKVVEAETRHTMKLSEVGRDESAETAEEA